MSTYKGWAIRLANGDFMNDNTGNVGPATFSTKREALLYFNHIKEKGDKVVRIILTVKEE